MLYTSAINVYSKIFNITIITVNILTYILILVLLFIILINFKFNKINNLKQFYEIFINIEFNRIFFILLISIAGIPPFSIFFSKFFLYIILFKSISFLILFFIFLQMYFLWFYLENLLYLKTNSFLTTNYLTNYTYIKNKINFNYKLWTLIIILDFLNIFFIFFLNPVIDILFNILFNIYL